MNSTIKFYNPKKGWGVVSNPKNPEKTDGSVFFHINQVEGPLVELLVSNKFENEPIICDYKESSKYEGKLEASSVRLDLTKRKVGYVKSFDKGHGWVEEFKTKTDYFIHHSSIRGSTSKFVPLSEGDPVLFTSTESDKGLQADDLIKIDNRCALEKFAEFEDFIDSLYSLKALAEEENWDYINAPTGRIPVLYSFINHTFDRILEQNKIVLGKSSTDGTEYMYFNTGLVTPDQDEIYGYFKKLNLKLNENEWGTTQPEYEFLEFNTDQSHSRKFFSHSPKIATYFSEAEVRELVFDTSLNGGKIILDKEHLKNRKGRFPAPISTYEDDTFFDAIEKGIELAIRRIKRNYKTAIPHSYDGKIQFLLPLCLLSKRDANLALVVNKIESVYKAHTVLSLDQAYNNARLLAKPDREWLNP